MTLPLYDPAWLERMYNNRALVPDHMDYFERWAQDSAQVRATVPCALDVAYGTGAGETLDVFRPPVPGVGRCPCWCSSTAVTGGHSTNRITLSSRRLSPRPGFVWWW